MNELKLKENLAEKIKSALEKKYPGKYDVNYDKSNNLIYRVIVNITKNGSNSNVKLKYEPDDPQKPARGDYAFQTEY